MKTVLLLTCALAGASVAAAAHAGRATGTVDGRALDLPLDCAGWQAGADTPTVSAGDGSGFDAALLGYNDSLAVTWETDAKTYQLMFSDVTFAPSVSVAADFSNRATGEAFSAEIMVDCAG